MTLLRVVAPKLDPAHARQLAAWAGAELRDWRIVGHFTIYARNRHETVEYYRKHGIDPYDRKAVKEDEERLRRKYRGS